MGDSLWVTRLAFVMGVRYSLFHYSLFIIRVSCFVFHYSCFVIRVSSVPGCDLSCFVHPLSCFIGPLSCFVGWLARIELVGRITGVAGWARRLAERAMRRRVGGWLAGCLGRSEFDAIRIRADSDLTGRTRVHYNI